MPNNVIGENKGSRAGLIRYYCYSPGNITLVSTKFLSMVQGNVNRFKQSLGNKSERTSLDNQIRETKMT